VHGTEQKASNYKTPQHQIKEKEKSKYKTKLETSLNHPISKRRRASRRTAKGNEVCKKAQE